MRSNRAVALPYSVRVGGPHPLHFGTGPRSLLRVARALRSNCGDKVRLFAATYAIGFVAVSMFIA